MKVRITFEFSDEDRRAIADRYGDPKPASHHDLWQWAMSTLRGDLDVVRQDYARSREEKPE